MVHVSVQVVSSYVTPWLSNTCLISVISFVITLYLLTAVRSMVFGNTVVHICMFAYYCVKNAVF
jgi:hypothetical protein